MGDLNCDYLRKNDHADIKYVFSVNGFFQLIKNPTRITATTATLIGVIQTTHPGNITERP